jgi:hypothetical protein
VQSLENLDTCDSVSLNQASEMGVSDSTNATSKKDTPAKVEDYFSGSSAMEFDGQKSEETMFGSSKRSFMMPRASIQLPSAEMPQDLSEPIVATKNILFPIKYQSPLTKIASTLEFRLPDMDTMVEKYEPKEKLFQPKDDGEYFMRFNSFRDGATNFAQKYLFKGKDSEEDDNEFLSQLSEDPAMESSYDEDSCHETS